MLRLNCTELIRVHFAFHHQTITSNEHSLPISIGTHFCFHSVTPIVLELLFRLRVERVTRWNESFYETAEVNYNKNMGVLSLNDDPTRGTTFIYEFTLSNDAISIMLPVKLNLFRGQSINNIIREVCPELDYHEICAHMANHVSVAYYGVEFAPSLPSAAFEDFTSNRSTIIQFLAERYRYNSFLEIGCASNANFNFVRQIFDVAVGVDPAMGGTLRMTSDDFFRNNTQQFDLIFLDGLHQADQLYRDVENSLNVLNDGGTIVLHDCSPSHQSYASTVFPMGVYFWNGDVYKAAVALRFHENIEVVVVDIDHGVGVIRKRRNQHPLSSRWQLQLGTAADTLTRMTWEDFSENKKELVRLITVKELRSWLDEESITGSYEVGSDST